MDRYLLEIGKLELITAEEEVQLAQRIQQGDELALEKLVRANLRFVVSVAKQYQAKGLTLGDLINEGNTGLVKAAMKFDEKRGFKFISYAVWWIRQAILQAIAEQSRIVRLPLNRVSSIQKLKKAFSHLEQVHQREPTAHELGLEVEMTEEDVQKHMDMAPSHLSLDHPIGEDDNSLLDVVEDEQAISPEQMLTAESLQSEILRALSTLSDRENHVMMNYYGIGKQQKQSLEEIGSELDISRERVRQIKESATRKLRETSRSKNLKQYLG